MIRVQLPEAEPVVIAGVASWLTSHPDITIADALPDSPVDVLVAVARLVDGPFLDSLGETARRKGAVVVLALDNMPDDVLGRAEPAQVVSLLPRGSMDRDRLVAAVVAAPRQQPQHAATSAESLVAALRGELEDVRATVHHHDHPMAVLEDREVELLKLVARGWGTNEIATKLSLSHRTVVNRVQVVVRKCGALNRCEAVAQAARVGLV
ncbi:LuxR C-terminal-related transcriptional regulator [Lentzea alba]|uniref:helix-turn-helix transcriptional regulator n=1 Tax=Lentzea alba TaxID=2714351 RepID=UPI0039BFE9CF